jgi:CHAD domain-containing protein
MPSIPFCTRRISPSDLRGRIRAALRRDAMRAPRPHDGEKAVHRLRVMTKRYRALLRLLEAAAPKDSVTRARKRLRNISRDLAPYRENAIAQEGLRRLSIQTRVAMGRHAPSHAEPLRSDQERIVDTSKRALSDLSRALMTQEALVNAVDCTFRRSIRRYRKARKHSKRDELLHGLRKSVKELRYELEWLGEHRCARHSKIYRKIVKLGDKLGDAHDLALLEGRLRSARNRELKPAIREVALEKKALGRRALKVARKILA